MMFSFFLQMKNLQLSKEKVTRSREMHLCTRLLWFVRHGTHMENSSFFPYIPRMYCAHWSCPFISSLINNQHNSKKNIAKLTTLNRLWDQKMDSLGHCVVSKRRVVSSGITWENALLTKGQWACGCSCLVSHSCAASGEVVERKWSGKTFHFRACCKCYFTWRPRVVSMQKLFSYLGESN